MTILFLALYCMLLICFSCLTLLAKTYVMLKGSLGSRHPCPVLDLKGKMLTISPFRMMLALGFDTDSLYYVRGFPFIPNLLRVVLS